MKLRILLAVLAFLPIGREQVQARLGETIAECEARYGPGAREGKVLAPATQALSYQKGDTHIVVQFMNGRSCVEEYSRSPVIGKELIPVLLEANAGGSKWKSTTGLSGEREDGAAAFDISFLQGSMKVYTAEWKKAFDAIRAAREAALEKESTTGF